MANYNDAVITMAGQAAVADALVNGKVITFTRIGIGDGKWTDDDSLQTATALKNELNSYGFTSKSAVNEQLELHAVILNYDAETTKNIIVSQYYMNELGVFCKIDNGPEILYSITTAAGLGDALSVYDGSNPIQVIYDYVTTISADAKIEIVLSPFATQENIDALQKQIDELKIIDKAPSLESERAVQNKVITEALYGMISGTTTIENTSDTVKTITTENTSVTSTTTVTKESDAVKKIITEISMAGDTTKYIKTTTITKTDTGSTIEYSYTKE